MHLISFHIPFLPLSCRVPGLLHLVCNKYPENCKVNRAHRMITEIVLWGHTFQYRGMEARQGHTANSKTPRGTEWGSKLLGFLHPLVPGLAIASCFQMYPCLFLQAAFPRLLVTDCSLGLAGDWSTNRWEKSGPFPLSLCPGRRRALSEHGASSWLCLSLWPSLPPGPHCLLGSLCSGSGSGWMALASGFW